VEIKKVREWFYPNREEIRELLLKCTALDAIPILIARRIHFTTFKILTTLGGVIHQTYNQLFPETDYALAELAKNKRLLGYHDIRLGNQPDTRLIKFINTNLPSILPESRQRFNEFKDIAIAYANHKMQYREFANLVLHRDITESVEPDDIPF
jgi:hypothetical protein